MQEYTYYRTNVQTGAVEFLSMKASDPVEVIKAINAKNNKSAEEKPVVWLYYY